MHSPTLPPPGHPHPQSIVMSCGIRTLDGSRVQGRLNCTETSWSQRPRFFDAGVETNTMTLTCLGLAHAPHKRRAGRFVRAFRRLCRKRRSVQRQKNVAKSDCDDDASSR